MNSRAASKLICGWMACGVLLFSGCGKSTNEGGTNANGNSVGSKGSSATAESRNPVDAIMKAFHAQLELKSFRVQIDTTSPGSGTKTRIVEFVAPDRFHMTGEPEMIVVGSAAYVKSANKWTKAPGDAGAFAASFRDPKVLEELNKDAEAKFIGPDVVDGTPAMVYEYTLHNAFGTTMTSKSTSWFRASDGVPLKVQSEGEVNGVKSKTNLKYYDFNADIKIEPPI